MEECGGVREDLLNNTSAVIMQHYGTRIWWCS